MDSRSPLGRSPPRRVGRSLHESTLPSRPLAASPARSTLPTRPLAASPARSTAWALGAWPLGAAPLVCWALAAGASWCAAELAKRGVVGVRDFRFFDGFCGWEREQLRDEVRAGLWHVAACSAAVLELATVVKGGLWEEVQGLVGERRLW
jgi:hypothetical protein